MKTNEDDELIAKFMGGVRGDINSDVADLWFFGDKHEKYLRYNTSMDWLFKVVEKIESILDQTLGECVTIKGTSCYITGGNNRNIIGGTYSSKIEAIYYTIIEFIKWYNQHNNEE